MLSTRCSSCTVRPTKNRTERRGTDVRPPHQTSARLLQGRGFRILKLVDNFSRENLALRAAQRFRGDDVVKVLEGVTAERRLPRTICVDNGPEFISTSLNWWAYFNGVKLDFSRPGKPTDNAFIESFNGKFRLENLVSLSFQVD